MPQAESPTGRQLKARLRAAGVACDSCRWLRIGPGTILGKAFAYHNKPLGYWTITLPRGDGMRGRAACVLAAEGIDVRDVQFFASEDDFSPEERAVINAGGIVDGWSRG